MPVAPEFLGSGPKCLGGPDGGLPISSRAPGKVPAMQAATLPPWRQTKELAQIAPRGGSGGGGGVGGEGCCHLTGGDGGCWPINMGPAARYGAWGHLPNRQGRPSQVAGPSQPSTAVAVQLHLWW